MKFFIVVFLIACCASCARPENQEECCEDSSALESEINQLEESQEQDAADKKVKADSVLLMNSLVDVQTIDPTIQVELKYTTKDNFMKRVLYHNIQHAYLQQDVAERLALCQQDLKAIHPNFSLLIYDAVRPVSVQQAMWNALDTIPVHERGKFVSNPRNRSMHNYGAAVDITIVDENGQPLDMGAGYDDIRKIAYPSMEWKFIASGELTEEHIENRKLLRKILSGRGFRNIPTEWWHFNACSKESAARKYAILLTEPNY